MLQLSDFSYHLPPELIAQAPLSRRDQSRLLLLNRSSQTLSHYHFYDLPELLRPGDVLVRNNTKVIPMRLTGHKQSGGKVEVLLIKKDTATPNAEVWECLSKPGLKIGQQVFFEEGVTAQCLRADGYTRWLQFRDFSGPFITILDQIGATPIPPYIHSETSEDELRRQYQTIYAKKAGSAAAPTAGLHFTPELDQRLQAAGIEIQEVTLHVGLGTFSPVKEKDITQHHMHKEWFELSPATAATLSSAKRQGRRIIAVGTTTIRVLETCSELEPLDPTPLPHLVPQTGETAIYIYPPYQFKCVDGLITNFHLPESTLLMLVSALVTQPNTPLPFSTFSESLVGQAYQAAIAQRYRFFSFGDGMLII